MTMMNSVAPGAPPAFALTWVKSRLLDLLIRADGTQDCQQHPLSCSLAKITRLSCYLARAQDPAPGNIVMWREPPG